jgi:hypothetical protein
MKTKPKPAQPTDAEVKACAMKIYQAVKLLHLWADDYAKIARWHLLHCELIADADFKRAVLAGCSVARVEAQDKARKLVAKWRSRKEPWNCIQQNTFLLTANELESVFGLKKTVKKTK